MSTMSVQEIIDKMNEYDGKAAPCDRKYIEYQPVETPKINLLTFIQDLNYILTED